MSASPHTLGSPPAKKPPFSAFAMQEADLGVLRQFAEAHKWSTGQILKGDITTATEHLRVNPSPSLLVVEIPSAEAAPALLNSLAEVCDPDTRVIVIGDVNEYSFYCWLTEIGVFSYQLKPLTLAGLDQAWAKAIAPPPAAAAEQKKGRFIGVVGARGGVGATTIALYLTALLAENASQKVAMVDMDPQDGTVSLLLDLEPSRGFREAVERPDRIDSLFLERVMQGTPHNFSVLSAEESIAGQIKFHDQAAEPLLRELSAAFGIVVLDLPRRPTAFYRAGLASCETVLIVTDYSLLGLRDSLRMADVFRDHLHLPPPTFVANKMGIAPKFEMTPDDFAKGLNAKVEFQIPFAPEVFMTVSAEMEGLKSKSPAIRALRQLAVRLGKTDPADEPASAKGAKTGWRKGK